MLSSEKITDFSYSRNSECLHFIASSTYKPFIEQIESCIVKSDPDCGNGKALKELVLLDAGFAVEQLIPATVRSAHGIFFTEEKLASRIASLMRAEIASEASFFDPACGAGNLLLAIAKDYPLRKSLLETLRFWAKKFGGCDLNENFILATKLRLIGLAAYRHGVGAVARKTLNVFLSYFNLFKVCNYLDAGQSSEFDCVVANPPFGHVVLSEPLSWSSGKTQQAAVFMARILEQARPGQKVTAILPDVLRSGTRYSRWRSLIELGGENITVEVHGKFSKAVDVDVFFITFTLPEFSRDSAKANFDIWRNPTGCLSAGKVRLGDKFTVRVGPVVPHRLSGSGMVVPYLSTGNATPFGTVVEFGQVRFSGTLYEPPFVLVRRTSNPSDKKRIVTTLVIGERPVAIENHLVILKPKGGGVEQCEALIEALNNQGVYEQLNQAIRCRHLTVSSLANLHLTEVTHE
ncbi:N-6 DNA methylase [Pseudomonas corrugata]|uniref:N-6 DNA methylase n=1 Tax=Pseudomonas corrugata TaxID=47879 RepID=UPI0028C3EB4D|nr:N-6 DNA methylase [Pseudomonas corrugata]MDU9025319.1 N-6 DNA methylase [Pseudomonas corrugata]